MAPIGPRCLRLRAIAVTSAGPKMCKIGSGVENLVEDNRFKASNDPIHFLFPLSQE